jgi:two-component sensor histidine kinase
VVSPEEAHYIGMALHELGSNAVKYGALAQDGGRVIVRWRVAGDDAAPRLDLEWCEEGGVVAEPARLGFGATILNTLAPRAIDGVANLTFNSDGVRWTLNAPLPPQRAIATEEPESPDLAPLPTSAAIEP